MNKRLESGEKFSRAEKPLSIKRAALRAVGAVALALTVWFGVNAAHDVYQHDGDPAGDITLAAIGVTVAGVAIAASRMPGNTEAAMQTQSETVGTS